jgi:hypothetical protein
MPDRLPKDKILNEVFFDEDSIIYQESDFEDGESDLLDNQQVISA